MHMDTGELKKHKHDTISLLEIVSMEGRYYMVRFYLEGQGYLRQASHVHRRLCRARTFPRIRGRAHRGDSADWNR